MNCINAVQIGGKMKTRLTAKFKTELASIIITQVRKGSDTIYKLKKVIDKPDREIRSAINYALKHKVPFVSGNLNIKYKSLVLKKKGGKTYDVVNF
tara:strand:+ start:141 stop:428 length:288 start_codon:yes stop_codon:yes gene_type:complete